MSSNYFENSPLGKEGLFNKFRLGISNNLGQMEGEAGNDTLSKRVVSARIIGLNHEVKTIKDTGNNYGQTFVEVFIQVFIKYEPGYLGTPISVDVDFNGQLVQAHRNNRASNGWGETYEVTFTHIMPPSGTSEIKTIIAYLTENSDIDFRIKEIIVSNGGIGDSLADTQAVHYYIYKNGSIKRKDPILTNEDESIYLIKNKARYNYVDDTRNEYFICECNMIYANKRKTGQVVSSLPKDHIRTKKYPSGGAAQTAYFYSDGSIVAEGNFSSYTMVKYDKDGYNKIALVRTPDSLSVNFGDLKMKFKYGSTARRYASPETFAAFLGVLAEMGDIESVSQGFCFEDATCFPSVSHTNGDSVDLDYLKTINGSYDTQNEQRRVNAFKKFHFTNIIYASFMTGLTGGTRDVTKKIHETHLHAGDFNISSVEDV